MVDRIGSIVDGGLVLKDGIPIPSWIDISITERCTRRCPMWCPKGTDMAPDQPLDMPVWLAHKISSMLKDLKFWGGVNLCGYGEPLAHPDVVGIVSSLRCHHVEMVTNGDNLDRAVVNSLNDAGLTHLSVSDYSGRAPELKKILSKATFTWEIRQRPQGPETKVNRGGVLDGGVYERDPAHGCNYPFYSMQVDWNGDVMVCVQDWGRRRKMGNLALQGLWDVWTGEPFQDLRREISSGKLRAPCAQCDTDGLRRGGLHRKAWKL